MKAKLKENNANVDYTKLPESIVKSLTELIERIKLILWIRGSLAVLAVVVVSILIVMGIDAATIIISPIYRWGLSSLVLVSFLIALYFYLYKPLTQPFTLTRVARFVELRHPELQERMSSIVELCRIDKGSSDFGSQRLIDQLAEEATFDASNVKPRQEINTKSVKPWFIAAGCVVGFIVVLTAIWPLRTLRLMTRVMAPASDVGSFFSDSIDVEPGNIRMIVGDPLNIIVKTSSPKINTAYMIKFAKNGKLMKERMVESVVDSEAEENENVKVFKISIPQVNDGFRYSIHAGHSVTEKYEVFAEIPPQIDLLDLIYSYPKYTGLGSVINTNSSGNISVVNGTKVRINAKLSKPINTAKIVIGGVQLPETNLTYTSQIRLIADFDVPNNINDKWEINIEDHFKFKNTPKVYSIVSIPDLPPTVDIFRPINKDLTLSPNGRFVINYFGFDDYGLTNAFLEVTKDNNEPVVHPLKKLVKEKDKEGIWSGNVRFDLLKFNLKNTSSLTIKVCVADALPIELGGPQIGTSEPITITIDKSAESLSRQSYDLQQEAITKILENVLQRLEDAVVDTKAINVEMSEERPDYIKVDEDSTDVASELSIANGMLDDLVSVLGDTAYKELIEGVQNVQTKGIAVAKESAEMIVMLDKDDKKAMGRKLRTSLEDSIMLLKNLFLELEELDKIVEEWIKAEELANKQEDLAADAEEILESGEMFDEDWVEDQKDIAEELSDVLESGNPEAIRDKLAEVKEATEELAKDAEELSGLQDKLAEATKEEKMETLSEAIEDGLSNDGSEKFEEAKKAAEEGDFDEAMTKAQEAVREKAEELAKDAKELETIGDILTDNQALNDADEKVSDLADKAQGETEKATDMASDISEQPDSAQENGEQGAQDEQSAAQEQGAQEQGSEATPEEQAAMQGQQEKAADALSDVSKGLEESKSALEQQISELDKQIAAQQESSMNADQQTAMETAMDAAMEAAMTAENAMEMANMEPSQAAQAQAQAQQAQSEALEAMTDAQAAQAEAMGASPEEAATAQAEASASQEEAAAAQAEATRAMADAQATLEGQPETQAAAEAQSAAAETQAAANEAQAEAASAQAESQAAMEAAAESPSEEATAAAQASQAAAAQAQTEAKAAQQSAQQTQAEAQKATAQAEAAMQEAQAAMMAAQQAAQALSQMMQQQAQQLGMTQQQMQSMASMNQPQPPSQQKSQQQSDSQQSSDSNNPQNKPEKVETGVIDPELLKNLGFTLEDWEKIRGGLKSGIISEGVYDNVPPEYRALVREYFKEIANQIQ
ncbi:MAG: hypothetical protein PF692_04455 [Kiritimatiellae bacterium]|nr:hypothetical protein [Kiritimatiellia bacterium]